MHAGPAVTPTNGQPTVSSARRRAPPCGTSRPERLRGRRIEIGRARRELTASVDETSSYEADGTPGGCRRSNANKPARLGLWVPDRDVPAVRLNDRLRDRQPEPHVCPRLVLGKERQEDPAEQFRRNSRTGISSIVRTKTGQRFPRCRSPGFKGADDADFRFPASLRSHCSAPERWLAQSAGVEQERRKVVSPVQRHRDSSRAVRAPLRGSQLRPRRSDFR